MRLTRYLQKIFAENATATQKKVFGSLAAGTPANAATVTEVQSLSNWEDGWYSAVVANNNPTIQDMNSAFFVFAYQLAYLMQSGVAEWNTGTEYFIGQICSDGAGNLYESLTNNNQGNALTVSAEWRRLGAKDQSNTASVTIDGNSQFVFLNPDGGNITQALPACASLPVGQVIVFKNVGDPTVGNIVELDADGGELIDYDTTLVLNSFPNNDSAKLYNNGTKWLIVQ